MEEENWAFGSLPKLVSHNDLLELRTLIQQTQVDLLSSIETLKSRIFDLETKLAIQSGKSSEPDRSKQGAKEISYNVFDFVSREELGIKEHEEPEIDYKKAKSEGYDDKKMLQYHYFKRRSPNIHFINIEFNRN